MTSDTSTRDPYYTCKVYKDDKISISLDNNVWDFLYEKSIDLSKELPREKFCLFITREVEIEYNAIPNHIDKVSLKDFIEKTIYDCRIETTFVFGFRNTNGGPERHGGFGVGTFMSPEVREFYTQIRPLYLLNKKLTKSRLSQNEADAAVASHSISGMVLTCENENKNGPIRYAARIGHRVVYLKHFDPQKESLSDFIISKHNSFLKGS